MTHVPTTHVLVIDDDPAEAGELKEYLSRRCRAEVETCANVDHARDVLDHFRPHVLVLVPSREVERHHELEELRRQFPRVPVVLVTSATSQDVLLDVEAFAPALATSKSGGLGSIASAVVSAVA